MSTLEERVAALEARPAETETLQPNYVTVGPDGTTTIEFDNAVFNTATINTATITNETVTGSKITDLLAINEHLTEFVAPHSWDFSANDAIDWQDGSGASWGYLQGTSPRAGDHRMDLGLEPPAPGGLPGALLSASLSAGIYSVGALVGPTPEARTFVDENGKSDFLQAGQTLFSKIGTGTLTWSGGSASGSLLVSTGGTGTGWGIACVGNIIQGGGFFDTAIVNISSQAGGDVSFAAQSRSGAAPAAGSTCVIAYLVWST